MDHFEESVKHDAYKESIPILLGWNAPFKLVCFCTVVGGSARGLTENSGMSSASSKQVRTLTSL